MAYLLLYCRANVLGCFDITLYSILFNLADQFLFHFNIQQETMSATPGLSCYARPSLLVVGLKELIYTEPGN